MSNKKLQLIGCCVLILLFSAPAFGDVITGVAAIPDGYYDGASGQGVVTTYSDFLTSCAATDIENQQSPITNHKLLIDGHLYIEVNGQIFNITGQRIK